MVIAIHDGGEKEMFKNKPKQIQPQQVYMPAYVDVLPEATRRSPIVAQDAADKICGVALRVGWISDNGSRRAIYRLKLRLHHASYGSATLPSFFILKDNVFVDYVQGVQDVQNVQGVQPEVAKLRDGK